jgi:hypothetical protein
LPAKRTCALAVPPYINDLGDDATVEQRLESFGNMRWRDTEQASPLIGDGYPDLGNAHLALDLKVGEAFDRAQAGLQLLTKVAQRIEIIAKNLERNLRPHARAHVIEAMGNRLADVDSDRRHGKARADVGDDLFTAAVRRPEVNVDFRGMNALGVLIKHCPARAASNRLHLRNL